MKKTLFIVTAACVGLGLSACSQPAPQAQETVKEEGFKPSLDTSSSCHISIAGSYDNFEALEAEFDHFNEYYPEVELVFSKVDDYNIMIGTILNGDNAPDIYVNYSWMYGREQYKESIEHAENLADPAPGLDLDCIRSNIILKTDDDTLPMVPVFSNTYGMLVNSSLFEKEGLMAPTKDLSFNSMYAAFGEIPESRILSPEAFGLMDDAVVQFRQALYKVATGEMTIDEAVAAFGTFEK